MSVKGSCWTYRIVILIFIIYCNEHFQFKLNELTLSSNSRTIYWCESSIILSRSLLHYIGNKWHYTQVNIFVFTSSGYHLPTPNTFITLSSTWVGQKGRPCISYFAIIVCAFKNHLLDAKIVENCADNSHLISVYNVRWRFGSASWWIFY